METVSEWDSFREEEAIEGGPCMSICGDSSVVLLLEKAAQVISLPMYVVCMSVCDFDRDFCLLRWGGERVLHTLRCL